MSCRRPSDACVSDGRCSTAPRSTAGCSRSRDTRRPRRGRRTRVPERPASTLTSKTQTPCRSSACRSVVTAQVARGARTLPRARGRRRGARFSEEATSRRELLQLERGLSRIARSRGRGISASCRFPVANSWPHHPKACASIRNHGHDDGLVRVSLQRCKPPRPPWSFGTAGHVFDSRRLHHYTTTLGDRKAAGVRGFGRRVGAGLSGWWGVRGRIAVR